MKNFLGYRYRQDLAKDKRQKERAIFIGFLAVIASITIRYITL